MKLNIGRYGKITNMEVEFRDGVTAISGPNGAGKSTLLDAILFAIYGRDRFGGQNEVEVQLAGMGFERWRTGKNTKAALTLANGQVVEGHRAILEVLLQAGWLTLEDAAITWFGQQGMLGFVNMTPTERRSLLERLLRLGVWDRASQEAKKNRTEVMTKLQNTTGALEEMEATLARLHEERVEATKELERLPENFTDIKDPPPYTLAQIEGAKLELADLQNTTELEEKIKRKREELSKIEQNKPAFDSASLRNIQNTVVRLEAKAKTAREAYAKVTPCSDDMRDACVFAKNAMANRDLLKKLEEELNITEAERGRLLDARNAYKAWEKQVAEIKTEVEQLTKELDRITEKKRKLEEVVVYEEAALGYDAEKNKLANRRVALEQRLRVMNQEIALMTDRLRDAKQKKRELTASLDIWSQAVNDFGPKGVRAFLIEQALPGLEERVNKTLEVIGAEYSIKLTIEKELSKGGKGTTMEVMMVPSISEPYPTSQASGGERVLLDIAFRTSLMEIMRGADYTVPDILILDETLAPLDTERRKGALMGIKKLGIRKVVLTSHVEELLDYADHMIEVAR